MENIAAQFYTHSVNKEHRKYPEYSDEHML